MADDDENQQQQQQQVAPAPASAGSDAQVEHAEANNNERLAVAPALKTQLQNAKQPPLGENGALAGEQKSPVEPSRTQRRDDDAAAAADGDACDKHASDLKGAADLSTTTGATCEEAKDDKLTRTAADAQVSELQSTAQNHKIAAVDAAAAGLQQQLIDNPQQHNTKPPIASDQQPQHRRLPNAQLAPPPPPPPSLNFCAANNSSGPSAAGIEDPLAYCKRRRASYLQSLLLRRWPFLFLAVFMMGSLIVGILLSGLTVYMMHAATSDCAGYMAAAAAAAAASSSPLTLAMSSGAASGSPLILAKFNAGADDALVSRSAQAANVTATQTAAAANATAVGQFQRLPSSVVPVHYDLFVQPRIAEPFNFSGSVSIRIKCNEPTDNITLHALELQLNERTASLKLSALDDAVAQQNSSSNATAAAANVPKIKRIRMDAQLQYAIIELDAKLARETEYVLALDFSGQLNDDLAGFYKIKYERQNTSETTWIAATQFEATDARRAFPCFDEPLYKATFSIQIKHWKNMTALSNMPIIDRQDDSQDSLWTTDTFAKTHRMSTYLVAFAVTNFESRSEGNISVWTRPGLVHTAEYALKIAGKILKHYEQFFGIEYPLPKMDMIALPDFNAGAMENWGLITYRETAMLFDEQSSSIANKQRVAVVVAHELAHQWFGNLVTPKWWDDLWLNEGFASYVEYIGVDHVEPKWRMLDQFVVEEVQNVFKVDGLSSSHQISIPVNNPDEISEIFDHISYAKGASIIRMMNHFLSEPVFKAGLKRYLRALRYGNAEQSDLWTHLTEAQRLAQNDTSSALIAAVNVERVMNSWTLQTGYPLVTLTRKYDKSRRAYLEQTRWEPYKAIAANSSSSTNATAAQKWEIPITLTWASEQNWTPNTRVWMHQNDSAPTQLTAAASQTPQNDSEWMLVNVNQVGYYRVTYDLRNWQLLIEQLNADHTRIGACNRAQILDDLFELARAGKIDYSFALDATKYLARERDYLPWDTVLMSFAYIDDMLQRTPMYGDWRDYIGDLIRPYYARYENTDWTLSSPSTTTTRAANNTQLAVSVTQQPAADANDVLEHYNQANAIAWACQVDERCIAKAKALFDAWKQTGKNQINPALRYATYCTSIENGNKDDWDFLWRMYEREQNASERDRMLRALGCSREMWILARYLEWTFNKSKPIRRQDGAFVFRMIAKNNYGRDIAFNFMRERWQVIREYYGKTSFSLGNLIRSISTSMNSQVELQTLLSFYDSVKADVGTGKRSFQIAIEEVQSNVAWRNKNYKILEEWIREERRKQPKNVATTAAASQRSLIAAH